MSAHVLISLVLVFSLTGCGNPPAPPPNPPPTLGQVVIENYAIGIEVDLDHGCSLSGAYLVGDAAKTNLINTHDLGRYVQVSYYSGPSSFGGCTFRGLDWPWNPIGAGDRFDNPAQIISFEAAANTSVTCTMRPIQWACNNVLCDCTVDIIYTLDEHALKAKVTLNMDRSDKTTYPPRDQELPAVYTNGPFYRLMGYTGSAPCTGDENVHEWNAGFDKDAAFPWVPGKVEGLTEPVLSLVWDNGFGLGVYSSLMDHFIAGFSGAKGSGGTKDGPTGYIAPVARRALAWNDIWTYDFALILGNLSDIRAKGCALAAADGMVFKNTAFADHTI